MSGSVKKRNIQLGGGSGGAGGWEGGHFFGSNGAVNNRFPETVMESQGISLSLSLPLCLSLSLSFSAIIAENFAELDRHYKPSKTIISWQAEGKIMPPADFYLPQHFC